MLEIIHPFKAKKFQSIFGGQNSQKKGRNNSMVNWPTNIVIKNHLILFKDTSREKLQHATFSC